MTMETLISAFLNYIKVEKGLAANTIAAYGRDLRKFARFAEKRRLKLAAIEPRRHGRVSGQLVSGSTGQPHGGAPSGFAAKSVPLRAGREEFDGRTPRSIWNRQRCGNRFRLICAWKKWTDYWRSPISATPYGVRDRAMIEVLYSTGLRVSELAGLRVSDLEMRMGCSFAK